MPDVDIENQGEIDYNENIKSPENTQRSEET